MSQDLLEGIRRLQASLRTLKFKGDYYRAHFQRTVEEARTIAKRNQAKAMAIMEAYHDGWANIASGVAADLQEAYRIGLDYSLQLTGCLRLAESVSKPDIAELVCAANAELEQLRVAVERLSDPIEQQNHDGRAMKLDGKTWPDIAESLGYQRHEWPTIRRRIVEWDSANGSLIPKGKPGRPKT